LRSDTNVLVNFIWNKEELPEQWKASIILPVYRWLIKLTIVIIEE